MNTVIILVIMFTFVALIKQYNLDDFRPTPRFCPIRGGRNIIVTIERDIDHIPMIANKHCLADIRKPLQTIQ